MIRVIEGGRESVSDGVGDGSVSECVREFFSECSEIGGCCCNCGYNGIKQVHLLAQQSAALELGKAVRASIEPLTHDVTEGGSCIERSPWIGQPMLP